MAKTHRQREERRKVSSRKVAENRKIGYISTTLRLPEGLQEFRLEQNSCTLRFDILDYVTGKWNPNADEPGMVHYELTYPLHRGIGADEKGRYVCPRFHHKACPICEYRSSLLKGGRDWQDKLVSGLKAKDRQLFLFYDLNNLEKGLQIWDFSYYNFGKLLDKRIKKSREDDGYEYFSSHGEDGMTLLIEFDEEEKGGYKFADAISIEFKPRKKPYPATLIDELPCLDDLLIVEPYDKLKKVLFEGEDEAEDEEEQDQELSKHEDPEPRKKPAAKSSGNGKSKASAAAPEKDEPEEEEGLWEDDEDLIDDECLACEGSGKNSRGGPCKPCKGTGKVALKEDDEEEEEKASIKAPTKSRRQAEEKDEDEEDNDAQEADDDDEWDDNWE